MEWYSKAVAQGHTDHMARLGDCFFSGSGVPPNHNIAALWYARGAALGSALAQHLLGCCYEEGTGVAQDFELAAEWHGKAAAEGVAEAVVRRDACLARLATDASRRAGRSK